MAAVCLLAGTALRAQQVVPDWMSKISVHGYFSQAYAVSEDHQIFGIPTDGTADYRDVALQLRYDPDRKNAAVIQLRHQRFGESITPQDTIELDWAFYQHNFSDRLAVKAGRIPLPLGIFNEAGGAAATSPFFRPANEFYARQYTSKTLDGVLGSVTLGKAAGWSFDVDAYAGQWALDQWNDRERIDARNAWGGQVWANTPWQGVRIGAGAYRCQVEPPVGYSADYLMLHGSVDVDLDRWRLATEYLSGNLATYGRYRALYGQVGFQMTRRMSVHARAAAARIEVPTSGHSLSADLSEDFGLSLNYAVHPAVLFKLEGHTNEGLMREDIPRNLYDDPSRTRYFIASVVATF